jgi:HSP20 family protein
MKMISYQPVAAGRLDQWVDEFFNRSLNHLAGGDQFASQPLVNVVETPTGYTLELAAPGMEKSDFEIKVEGDYLNVSARKEKRSEEGDGNKFLRKEFSFSTFSRSFRLPKNAAAEKIQAAYTNGVLQLSIPKTEVDIKRNRTIEIA